VGVLVADTFIVKYLGLIGKSHRRWARNIFVNPDPSGMNHTS
jgi:hypothetical protein